MTRVWSPGAGLQGGEGRAAGLHQHVVDRATGEDHQLEFDQSVFEVFLCGRALVDATIRRLQRADEEPVLCLQDAALGADLGGGTVEVGFKKRTQSFCQLRDCLEMKCLLSPLFSCHCFPSVGATSVTCEETLPGTPGT